MGSHRGCGGPEPHRRLYYTGQIFFCRSRISSSQPLVERPKMRLKMAFTLAVSVLLPIQVSADPFTPAGQTVSIAATATTARVQVRTSASSRVVRVYNSGTVPVFVACGDVTVLAVTTTSLPVGGGMSELVGCAQQYVAAVTSTTATVYFTPGEAQ